MLGILPTCGLEGSHVSRMNMSLATTEGVRGGQFSDTVFVVVNTVGLLPVVHSAKSVESLSTLGCPCKRDRLLSAPGENAPRKDNVMRL